MGGGKDISTAVAVAACGGEKPSRRGRVLALVMLVSILCSLGDAIQKSSDLLRRPLNMMGGPTLHLSVVLILILFGSEMHFSELSSAHGRTR